MTATPPFRLILWPHRILYLGTSPDNELHCHHAAQLCVSLDHPLRYRATPKSRWSSSQGVFIPPDHPHQIDAGDARIMALYLEPESDEYTARDPRRALQALNPGSEKLDALRALVESNIDAGAALATCMSIFKFGSDKPKLSPRRDARVQTVVERIRREPGRTFSARDLAESVYLSPSRLSYIFRKQTGIPIRRFIVWSRTRSVILNAIQGATLTEAAHAAGFSDAAHMSNAFRRLFGFAPSALFGADIPKDVLIIE